MYRKIDRDNKIFKSEDFLKDRYKFDMIHKILSGEEITLYSDEENFFLARNEVGKSTWIWTKDDLTDEKNLEEIKEVMSLYFSDLESDQFTAKKEFYDYLDKTDYKNLNREDYFEMGFLICENTKPAKKVDGGMTIATEEDLDIIAEYVFRFSSFIIKIMNLSIEAALEKSKEETREFIKAKELYTWKNKDGKIVSIAKYEIYGETARINHVYTPEEERSKGYAANLIHDMTDMLLAKGAIPLLYTDYSYLPSNTAYKNVGYEDKGILINFSCSKNK